MKTSHVIAAALLGLAIGIPLAWRMSARTPQNQASIPAQPERLGAFSLQATLELHDPLPAIKTARDFTAYKHLSATRPGSPYRSVPSSAAAIDQLPLTEILALLEAGELQGFEETGAAIGRWLEADPLAAYANIQRLPLADDDRRMARSLIFSHWAKNQPEQMLGMLEKLPKGEGRNRDSRDFLAAWQKENPGQAMRFLDRLAGLGQFGLTVTKIREDLLGAWLQKDREGAERWLETLPQGTAKTSLEDAMAVARLSLMKDAEAVQWISSHPGQKAAQARLAGILRNWASSDPASAMARLAEFPADHEIWSYQASGIAQSAMVSATMSKDAESLVTAVNALPEGPAKRNLLLGLIQGSASSDFALANRLLTGLPESREREQAASFFAEFLARKDPAAASEWLLGLEPSASRDLAANRFASTLAAERPEMAAEWADSIEDSARASHARYAVYSRWHQSDPEAAKKWRETWPKDPESGR